jgi:hypothetical protein
MSGGPSYRLPWRRWMSSGVIGQGVPREGGFRTVSVGGPEPAAGRAVRRACAHVFRWVFGFDGVWCSKCGVGVVKDV